MTINESQRRERNFYTAMSLALAGGVFVGFARTFFLKPLFPEYETYAAPESYFFWHGTVFTSWILLLVIQAWLVRNRSVAVHRKLGAAGMIVATAVVVTGFYGALIAANRSGGFIGVPMSPEAFLIVPVLDIVLFALFVGLAVHWRGAPQLHKRLMLFATLSITQAAFVRINPSFLGEFAGPIMQILLTLLFVLVVCIWDYKTLRRIHPATLWAGIPLFLSQPARFAIGETAAWQAIGRWLMQLV
jgi:uncharacterized membrane protein YozB (DUF420 family)